MPEVLGADWLAEQVEGWTDAVEHMTPVEFNEMVRYLPESVSPMPGPVDYAVAPFMRDIVNHFDPRDPIREVNLMKGVQITFTVSVLEAGILYYMAYIKTLPIMYITADKELADLRVEVNILPMLEESDLGHIIQARDDSNGRKTGKTKKKLEFEGGGYLVPFGANNPDKMRSTSIAVSIKDEVDGWPILVRDGCPDKLTDGRTDAYKLTYKTFRGSTPGKEKTSKILKRFKEGDQRKYYVPCKHCDHMQFLEWEPKVDEETGIVGGMFWEYDEDNILIPESVCYNCKSCGLPHFEHDKESMFSKGEWRATAKAKKPNVASYHLPGMYSPVGMKPWSACVSEWLDAWDPVAKKVLDLGALEVFYNNVLGMPFKVIGARVKFTSVSAHRRACYRTGEIPNEYMNRFSGSHALLLTRTVDVHKDFLAVGTWAWCRDMRSYLVEYKRIDHTSPGDGCDNSESNVWKELSADILEKEFVADDGKIYKVALTLVDAGWSNAVVTDFCTDFDNVYAIVGADKTAKSQVIKEFGHFVTKAGGDGFRINVDHYKDRIAPVLKREWVEDAGDQPRYHFNAPVDITDKQLKELTVEYRSEKVDDRGKISYPWYRPSGARNELWDLLVYAHASVEIIAWDLFTKVWERDGVDWPEFWEYLEAGEFYKDPNDPVQ